MGEASPLPVIPAEPGFPDAISAVGFPRHSDATRAARGRSLVLDLAPQELASWLADPNAR